MSDADNTLRTQAEQIVAGLRNHGHTLATAESCTGGMIAAAITDIAGASDVFERGFVTYSNDAKSEMLGVPAGMIAQYGAVSQQVARTMAEGALQNSHASIAVSVTGIAGPGGGSANKPVGLVHIACARSEHETLHVELRFGALERREIRRASVEQAFALILQHLPAPDIA